MCVKKFIFSKFASLQAYSLQHYYQINSFTGIFQQHFKPPLHAPPMYWLKLPPIKFWRAHYYEYCFIYVYCMYVFMYVCMYVCIVYIYTYILYLFFLKLLFCFPTDWRIQKLWKHGIWHCFFQPNDIKLLLRGGPYKPSFYTWFFQNIPSNQIFFF